MYPNNKPQPDVHIVPNTLEASAHVVRNPGGYGKVACGDCDFRYDSYIIRPSREGGVVTILGENFTPLPPGFFLDQIQIKIPLKNEK